MISHLSAYNIYIYIIGLVNKIKSKHLSNAKTKYNIALHNMIRQKLEDLSYYILLSLLRRSR